MIENFQIMVILQYALILAVGIAGGIVLTNLWLKKSKNTAKQLIEDAEREIEKTKKQQLYNFKV